MTIVMETVGFPALERALRDAPAIAERETRVVLEEGAGFIAAEARRRLHTRTGRTKVYTRVEGTGPQLRALVKLRGRGAFWGQRGRGPGKMPPLRAILAFVRRAGLVGGTFDVATRASVGTIRRTGQVRRAERDVAWMIARAIARGGSQTKRPFLAPAFLAARPQLRALFATLPERIVGKVAAEARRA